MINTFFPISFILFGVFFLTLSRSKKNHAKLVEHNGEKFANRVNKGLNVSGWIILNCSLVWFLLKLL